MRSERIEDRIQALAEDREHGASELARRGLRIAADAAGRQTAADTAELIHSLGKRADEIAATRPSMAPMYNLLHRWRARLETLADESLESVREAAAELALDLARASEAAVDKIAQHVGEVVASGDTILTHSLSSTVRAAFKQLKERSVHAIITESRPLNEGHRLAQQLSQWKIPTTLITDAQLGLFVKDADVVLVGADSLLPDGSAVNKAGTYLLALAARDQGVPFYVCCESFKRRPADMQPLELEEKNRAELDAPELPGLSIRNIYFDVTPAHLVTGWIDENGLTLNRT